MFSLHRVLLTALGLGAGLIGVALVNDSENRSPPTSAPLWPASPAKARGTDAFSDPVAVKAHAWQRAQALLAEADHKAAQALDKHLASIHGFLDERKAGTRAFAERLLSLRSKWELVKDALGTAGDYTTFLTEAFEEHVFPAKDLEKAVNAAVRGYLAELDGIENELLVRLRADLADDQLPVLAVLPALRTDATFKNHYQGMSRRVERTLHIDLAVIAGRELFLWEAANIATDLTLKAGAAAASRLGVSTTLLSAGAASFWETLAVGLVVGIALDAAVDKIMKLAGYDAEKKIAERVSQTLEQLGSTITDGDPDARQALGKLKTMQRDDPDEEVRAACTETIKSMEAGTQLYGLRRELSKIGTARAALRKETLRRLIQEGEENQ